MKYINICVLFIISFIFTTYLINCTKDESVNPTIENTTTNNTEEVCELMPEIICNSNCCDKIFYEKDSTIYANPRCIIENAKSISKIIIKVNDEIIIEKDKSSSDFIDYVIEINDYFEISRFELINYENYPYGENTLTIIIYDGCANSAETKIGFVKKYYPPKAFSPVGIFCTPNDVVFKWEANIEDAKYELNIATNSTFNQDVITINDIDTLEYKYSIDFLKNNTDYYWKVRARVGKYQTDWSDTLSFQLQYLPTPIPITPINNTVFDNCIPRDLTFTWVSTNTCLTKDFQISYDESFKNLYTSYQITGTSFRSAQALPPAEKIYWRLRENCNDDCYSRWTETMVFSVNLNCKPKITINNKIESINMVCGNSIEVTWDKGCICSSSRYRIQYANHAPDQNTDEFDHVIDKWYNTLLFGNSTSFTTNETPEGMWDTQTTIPLINGYYWIRIASSDGAYIGPYEQVNVKVGGNLNKPQNLSTSTPTTNTLPTFTWTDDSAGIGADYYRIQITTIDPNTNLDAYTNDNYIVDGNLDAFDSNGNNGINGINDSFVSSDGNKTFTIPTGFELDAGTTADGKTYWIRVRGENGEYKGVHCDGEWSNSFEFVIKSI